MAGTSFDLSLIIKAVDKATKPMKEINERMRAFTAPVRKLSNHLHTLAEEAGLTRVGERVKGVFESVEHVGHSFEGLIKKALLMEFVGGLAMFELLKGSAEAGAELGKMAEQVGLTADEYAGLRYAAGQADVTQESFNSAMSFFTKQLGQAKAGGGQMLAFLNKVSPAFALQVKHAKNTEEALQLVTAAFERVKDPQRRAALGAAFFGREGGIQMAQFLGRGREAVKAWTEQFEKLAGPQDEFVERSESMERALKDAGVAFGGVRNAAMTELMPALTELTRKATDFIVRHRDSIVAWAKRAAEAIQAWVQSGGFEKLIAWLGKWGDRIDWLVEHIGGLKGVLVLLGGYMAGEFVMAVAGLVSSLWGLGSAVVSAAISLGGLLWSALGSVASAILSFNFAPIIAGLSGMASATWAALVPLLPFLAAAVGLGAAIYAIVKNAGELKEAFTTWTGALNMLKAVLDLIIAPLESLKTAGEWWAKQFGFGSARQALNAGTALPAAGTNTNNAAVRIDIPNLPRGARVTTDPASAAPVDLNLGYSYLGGA